MNATKKISKFFIEVRPVHAFNADRNYGVTGYTVSENYLNVGAENFERTLAIYDAGQYQDALDFGSKCAIDKGCDLVRPGI